MHAKKALQGGGMKILAKKQVRRTPLCLEFGVWDLEFPDKPGPFWFRLGWHV